MNGKITIRPYRASDDDALIELFRRSVREVACRNYSAEQVAAWAPDDIDRREWRARRQSKPSWVAEINGTPAGFSDLGPNGRIDMMYVHPECQGQGVASALLAHIEAEARKLGLERLTTHASLTAQPFFQSRGFAVMATQEVRLRGRTFRNVRMAKPLRDE